MNFVGLSASLNIQAQRFALKWAEEHLPEVQYRTIKASYYTLLKRTALFVILCCIPIILAFLFLAFEAPFSKSAEANAMPNGATGYVLARTDYDGNFFWTHNSQKYEYPLVEYGLDPEKYQFGDKVKVYIDDMQQIVKVTEGEKGPTIRNIEIGIGVIGSIFIPVLLIMCVFRPIAYRTFGKSWITFYKEFEK